MNPNPFNSNPSVIDITPNGTAFQGYAGFWRRLIAYAVDALIVGVPLMILGRLTGTWYCSKMPLVWKHIPRQHRLRYLPVWYPSRILFGRKVRTSKRRLVKA